MTDRRSQTGGSVEGGIGGDGFGRVSLILPFPLVFTFALTVSRSSAGISFQAWASALPWACARSMRSLLPSKITGITPHHSSGW